MERSKAFRTGTLSVVTRNERSSKYSLSQNTKVLVRLDNGEHIDISSSFIKLQVNLEVGNVVTAEATFYPSIVDIEDAKINLESNLSPCRNLNKPCKQSPCGCGKKEKKKKPSYETIFFY